MDGLTYRYAMWSAAAHTAGTERISRVVPVGHNGLNDNRGHLLSAALLLSGYVLPTMQVQYGPPVKIAIWENINEMPPQNFRWVESAPEPPAPPPATKAGGSSKAGGCQPEQGAVTHVSKGGAGCCLPLAFGRRALRG